MCSPRGFARGLADVGAVQVALTVFALLALRREPTRSSDPLYGIEPVDAAGVVDQVQLAGRVLAERRDRVRGVAQD